MIRHLWKLVPQGWRRSITTYWPVVVLLPATAAVLALFWIFERATGSNLTANLPAELIGVAISAVVTILIVERAMRAAEERRLQPALESVGRRMQDVCDECITLLALYSGPDLETHLIDDARDLYSGPSLETHLTDHARKARRQWLRGALDRREAFSHTGEEVRHTLYEEIARYHEQLQNLAISRQIIIELNPRLEPLLAKVQQAMAEWSIYCRGFDPKQRRTDRQDADRKQVELVTMRRAARTFLALSDEIRDMRGASTDEEFS